MNIGRMGRNDGRWMEKKEEDEREGEERKRNINKHIQVPTSIE